MSIVKALFLLTVLFFVSPLNPALPAAMDPKRMRAMKASGAIGGTGPTATVQEQAANNNSPITNPVASPVAPKTDLSIGQPQNFPGMIPPAAQEDTEDLTKIIHDMKSSSVEWKNIKNPVKKEMSVYFFITEYKDKGITISKPAKYYAALIDQMAAQSPGMLSQPLEQILQLVAIMEYDFDNGQDKDALVRNLLGEEGYLRNKQRLGL